MKAKIFKLSMALIFAIIFCSVADDTSGDPDGTKFWGWDTFNYDIVRDSDCPSGFREIKIQYYRMFWISTGISRDKGGCIN
jgi:hypothetical protein